MAHSDVITTLGRRAATAGRRLLRCWHTQHVELRCALGVRDGVSARGARELRHKRRGRTTAAAYLVRTYDTDAGSRSNAARRKCSCVRSSEGRGTRRKMLAAAPRVLGPPAAGRC